MSTYQPTDATMQEYLSALRDFWIMVWNEKKAVHAIPEES